eukprot:symbB.v1.2.001861.t1/scaffold77.1/size347087/32
MSQSGGKEVIVKVTAEDEESRRYSWQCHLSWQQKIMPLRRKWAEAHGVEEEADSFAGCVKRRKLCLTLGCEAVLFLDPAGSLVDLEKSPTELGWKDTVELCSVPASDEWAEGGAAKPQPKRAKIEKVQDQTQLPDKAEVANGGKTELDDKPLADLGGSLPGDDEPVEFQAENPKRSGTTAYERYEKLDINYRNSASQQKYKLAKTIAAAIEKGAARGDIANDFKKGFFRRV